MVTRNISIIFPGQDPSIFPKEYSRIIVDGINIHHELILEIDQRFGYSSYFLEKVFSNLPFTEKQLRNKLWIKSADQSMVDEIWEYIEAGEMKKMKHPDILLDVCCSCEEFHGNINSISVLEDKYGIFKLTLEKKFNPHPMSNFNVHSKEELFLTKEQLKELLEPFVNSMKEYFINV